MKREWEVGDGLGEGGLGKDGVISRVDLRSATLPTEVRLRMMASRWAGRGRGNPTDVDAYR